MLIKSGYNKSFEPPESSFLIVMSTSYKVMAEFSKNVNLSPEIGSGGSKFIQATLSVEKILMINKIILLSEGYIKL